MTKILTIPQPKRMDYEELAKSFATEDRMSFQMGKNTEEVIGRINGFISFIKELNNEDLLRKGKQLQTAIKAINTGISNQMKSFLAAKQPHELFNDPLMGRVVMAKGLLSVQLEEITNELASRGV